MKIRELFEEVNNPIIKLCYEFSCHTGESAKLNRNLKQITSEISEKAGDGCFCNIAVKDNSFTVFVTIPEKDLDATNLYIDDVKSILRQHLDMNQGVREDDDDRRCEVYFNGDFPKLQHPINFSAIHLFPKPSSNATLTGIAKAIGDCDYLEIENCGNITGSVLGLIKLAKNTPVALTFKGAKPDWVSIVNKYLKKEVNIVACQEDLFKNGLDEYAKL